jgi:predicted nucleic acid-binding protein
MIVLSNSSPLIYLAKLGRLDLLKTLYKKAIVPEAVLAELQDSTKYPELILIEQAIGKWIVIKKVKIHLRIPGLGSGEVALINLAKEIRPDLILIDDASARKIIESSGFNVKGTIYVLLLAYRKKIIAKNEARNLIDNLILTGFRISTEIYSKVMKELE